ncbi:MAG TPA: glutathione transferase GstA [Alphaproteobacteria bacterium]|nr:glutathione transferase GstA [Alphaproteobacteria bacterium]
MKLYYSPGACSLAPHILLQESKAKYTLEKVDLKTKITEKGEDFKKINPKGYVPTLQLDNGEVLTEGPAIMQYIADQAPNSKLAPAAGTMARYRLQEWLNFITSEIHKGFSPLFNPAVPDAYKTMVKENLGKRFDYLSEKLTKNNFLMGNDFTAPDAYLYTTLTWSGYVGIDLSRWPALQAFVKRVGDRPAVKAAHAAEKSK